MNTVKIFVNAEDLFNLINTFSYTDICLYRADTEDGTFTVLASIPLVLGQLNYSYLDMSDGKWYKYSFKNGVSESALTIAFQTMLGGTEKVGYTFNNYNAPIGLFGEVLTADDIRYSYLWGIDLVAQDTAQTPWDDNQTKFFIDAAVQEIERTFKMNVYKRIYKTSPSNSLRKSVVYMQGVDYTDEETPYDFEPDKWSNFGFLQLRHYPILSIERADLVGPTQAKILDLIDWVRTRKKTGQIHFFPKNQMIYGPPLGGLGTVLLWQMKRYPQGFEVDYTAGFESADKVPSDLRDIIGKIASIKILTTLSSGILPVGQSSQSIGIDGLSESASFTQTPTTLTFQARIEQYKKDIDDYLQKNKYTYSIPMGFVGGT